MCNKMHPELGFCFRHTANCFPGGDSHRGYCEVHKEDSLCRHIGVDDRFDVSIRNVEVKTLFGYDLNMLY